MNLLSLFLGVALIASTRCAFEYSLGPASLDWYAAENWCATNVAGSHLATISSDAESQAAQAVCSIGGVAKMCWLGINQLSGATWEWADQSAIGYAFNNNDGNSPITGTYPWDTNQPDNANEQCVVLAGNTKWHDYPCGGENILYALCSIEPVVDVQCETMNVDHFLQECSVLFPGATDDITANAAAISANTGNIGGNAGDISGLRTDVDTNIAAISANTGSVTSLTSQLTALQNEMTALQAGLTQGYGAAVEDESALPGDVGVDVDFDEHWRWPTSWQFIAIVMIFTAANAGALLMLWTKLNAATANRKKASFSETRQML